MDFNPIEPKIMHIDLNSCFASVEQQANPKLRNKPVIVVAYNSPKGCILSPSIEAKKLGIKTGMRVMDAKQIEKNVIVLMPDPPKYRDVHKKFINIFKSYTPKVIPKSIDEAILNFNNMPDQDLINIAEKIKTDIKSYIGEWIRCSIGISTNQFLSKVASNLHKPNGLDVINKNNILEILNKLKLIDLPGINIHYEARLNSTGIFSPIDFYNSNEFFLRKYVFKSIVGYYWYLRLKGYEPDSNISKRKSFGQQYALGKKTKDPKELSRLMMKMCENMGRELRTDGYSAKGIHLALYYEDNTYWHKSKTFNTSCFNTWDLYRRSILIFNQQPIRKVVKLISVSCFNLANLESNQMTLFETSDKENITYKAVDKINDRWGEYTIIPARMMDMDNLIIDRIAFG